MSSQTSPPSGKPALPPTPGPPLLHLQDGRATITFNRPVQHNRLHVEDLLTLQQHLASLAADPSARLLVITGQGPSFCSGLHIGEFDGPAAASAGPQSSSRRWTHSRPWRCPRSAV